MPTKWEERENEVNESVHMFEIKECIFTCLLISALGLAIAHTFSCLWMVCRKLHYSEYSIAERGRDSGGGRTKNIHNNLKWICKQWRCVIAPIITFNGIEFWCQATLVKVNIFAFFTFSHQTKIFAVCNQYTLWHIVLNFCVVTSPICPWNPPRNWYKGRVFQVPFFRYTRAKSIQKPTKWNFPWEQGRNLKGFSIEMNLSTTTFFFSPFFRYFQLFAVAFFAVNLPSNTQKSISFV